MYNEREKLFHHQQLHSPKDAAADLALLKRLKPTHPRLQEFGFSPSRCAGDILMALLDIVHRDDIVKNRLQHKQAPKPEPAPGEEEDSEKQELKDQLEEKEEEVADLQDQLDEKEDQIADLEEQLAEEKKSEENPAKKTAAKKSTAKKGGSKKK